ncbi:splicing factor-like protein 1 isoform X3 [Neltuma alba]|nr:splicing factor-like protein 1 isoform X3 [Prosopis alba]XP_028801559.1 splicing factor-like protein 1 isoform X3 [Prosopis alba]XP_028801560.1 splicing factor-like protein 1 isoform X3 [Prosopis alba]XP_028801561.1 splicing factor-like protein 1 isoform X3 [Prosopis alba]XP_028801562.1 splicing factor-like protein 1 isoform X3 [Prosopis alba]
MSGFNSSAAPNGGQRLSMLAAKSGFVIPKNKLSGSLVPIFKGAKNHGATGTTKEESSKQIHRKTKWGPDLTQDAAVRRGRTLALKIRVDQISHQLKSQKSEVEDTEGSSLGAEDLVHSYPNTEIDDKLYKKSEMLEHEKREAIGEILRLDPSYKPPLDFKPLLKEASVPLPVKEYPGFNFISLIYGPEGDNHKRVEKETGAKIEVHGIKAGEKAEIKPGNDVHDTYEEMHVIVSADSFEKVDAAVSIIELLITSVTGNLATASATAMSVSVDNTNVPGENVNHAPSHLVSVSMENQAMAVAQPVAGVAQTLGAHFQHSGPWSSAISSQNPAFAPSGNVASPNPSGLPRPLHFPSQSMNSSIVTSNFAAQHATVTGFNSVIPNRPLVQSQPAREHLQHSHMTQTSPVGLTGPPRNPSVVSRQTSSVPTNVSASFPLNRSQPAPVGHQTSVPLMLPPMSGILPAPVPDRSLTSVGAPSGLAGVSPRPGNMGQVVPPHRPVSLHVQPDVAFKPPVSSTSHSTTFPPHHAGTPVGLPSSLGPMQPLGPTYSSIHHLSGSSLFPSPRVPTSLPLSQQSGIPSPASGVTYHNPGNPPPLSGPNSGNFTFRPQRPNADFQVVSRPNTATQGGGRELSSGPRPPSFGFAVPNQPVNQIFPRTQMHNQVDQTKNVPYVGPFGGGPGSLPIPSRPTALPFASQPDPRSAAPQMAMRNFFPSPQMANFPSPGPPRAGNMQIRQNHPAQRWPEIPLPPNQRFGNNHLATSGRPLHPSDQIYDPFSPTSVAAPQQKSDPAK